MERSIYFELFGGIMGAVVFTVFGMEALRKVVAIGFSLFVLTVIIIFQINGKEEIKNE